MQILESYPSSRGKLGGLVASAGRAGAQLRARHTPTNPRSNAQQANRAIIGALPGLWRQLSTDQQEAWVLLSAATNATNRRAPLKTLSGYSLFMRCNRNLATAGLPPLSNAAPVPPSMPAIEGFAVNPIYNQPGIPHYVTGWAVSYLLGTGANVLAVLRASPAVSPGRGNIRPSEYRIMLTYSPFPPVQELVIAPWFAKFGTLPSNGQIAWAINFLDPKSGFASPWVKAFVPFQTYPPPTPVPGTITIEQNGTPIATISNVTIEIGGAPIAGA